MNTRAGLFRRRSSVLGGGLMLSLCVYALATACVGNAQGLRIKDFSLRTTRTVEAPGARQELENKRNTLELAHFTHESYGFTNEPYAFTQAGGHPDALTTTMEFETEEVGNPPAPVPVRDPRDIAVSLPPGLLGDPVAVERCSRKQALAFGYPCPASTQVGIAVIYLQHGEGLVGPIVNVDPETGQSAEFAIETNHKINFVLTGHVVRTENPATKQAEYDLTVVSNGIPDNQIYKTELTFWGVPAAPEHDVQRGLFCGREVELAGFPPRVWACGSAHLESREYGLESSGLPEVPFVTLPANCSVGPEQAVMRADSWEEPGKVGVNGKYEGYTEEPFEMPGVTDCNLLQFEPNIGVEPDTKLADAPVGLGVDLTVPQFEEPHRLATPEIRTTTFTFPFGMSVNPGVVDGVQACNESGPEGINFEGPESEERGFNGELQLAPGHCPDASILGTAEAETPLLRVPIKGHVYLARPGCGGAQSPCTEQDALDGNLYQLYLELGGTGPLADTGVNIKVRLKTEANPATGQLTAVAEEVAQLPFSNLKVDLNGGPRAPIANPPVCGTAMTTAHFTSWAAPGTTPQGVFMSGLGDATPSSFFAVEGCGSPPGLSPGFVAGTVTPSAGKFSEFTLNISRKDREQYIRGVQVHTPPGLLGVLASVPLCGEAEADRGTCSEASKIGTTRVASGAGSHPFEIEGSMYLTGPHDGAPFGLSVVTDAVAGPFDLGKVVVRARIDVSPSDSSLTITTDESGPYKLPQIIFGVPLRLQRIAIDVNRPSFMFNPTNCDGQRITASISGSEGAVTSVTSPFAVGGCRSLAFKPSFKVSTSGHTSRKLGASLDAKLSYPKGAMGSDANIARVKVSLPQQLPSFLATLQKACTAGTFEKDPAHCPMASIVGIARAHTPLLPVELEGPVYFVSHGGEAWPLLIVVLEGDNTRVDLVGNTLIRKDVTSSTFNAVPDVPVESFELYLPQGKNHALAANGKLCKEQRKLVMPTEFVAQNGVKIHKNTRIAVIGCGKKRAKNARPRRQRAKNARPRRRGHAARVSSVGRGNQGTSGRSSR